MVTNFLALPEELRCRVIQENPLSLEEINSLARTSKQLNWDLHTCLTQLISPGDEGKVISLEILLSFPNLVRCDYPVTITSLDDLIAVARLRNLQDVTLSLEDFAIEQLPLSVRIKEEAVVLTSIDEVIVYFFTLLLGYVKKKGSCS